MATSAVNVMRSLWDSVQGDPKFMRRVNGWLTLLWIAMIPISIEMGWLTSVAYVSALSLWALVSGHWAAWQAARVECEQQRQADEYAKHPIEDKVTNTLIARTTIEESLTDPLDDRAQPVGHRQGRHASN